MINDDNIAIYAWLMMIFGLLAIFKVHGGSNHIPLAVQTPKILAATKVRPRMEDAFSQPISIVFWGTLYFLLKTRDPNFMMKIASIDIIYIYISYISILDENKILYIHMIIVYRKIWMAYHHLYDIVINQQGAFFVAKLCSTVPRGLP